MSFEWDEAKRLNNLLKHGVDFRRAIQIFDGRVFETVDNRRDYGEPRITSLGEIEGRVYSVTYTPRSEPPDHQREKGKWPRNESLLRECPPLRRGDFQI